MNKNGTPKQKTMNVITGIEMINMKKGQHWGQANLI